MIGYRRQWIHFIGIASLAIVFLSHTAKPFSDAIFHTLFNFDSSLSAAVQDIVNSGAASIVQVIVILAHIGIFVYIFLLFSMYIFPTAGFMNILYVALFIMLLHTVHFAVVDKNPVTWKSAKDLLPGSGIIKLVTNLDKITLGSPVVPGSTNATNSSVNLDLS